MSSVSGDSDASSDSWYYDIYDLEEASKYPSQACFNVRGVSYTPPSWKRVYKKRPNENVDGEEAQAPCAKKLKM